MTNKDIVDYVMKTPRNTNPSVLITMLEIQDQQELSDLELILSEYVKSVNDVKPDENGNVKIELPNIEDDIATDEDAMDLLAELNIIEPITTYDGSILTSPTGEIYSL